MSAIDFVVRGDVGSIQRGVMSGEPGATALPVGAGNDVSLHLDRSQILSYVRQGQALHITLVNGEVLVLDGFFAADGTPQNGLYISSDGLLAQVNLTTDSAGTLYGTYVDQDVFGKWSPDDDLYFVRGEDPVVAGYVPTDDEVGMLAFGPLAGGLLPLLGLGATAAVIGGVGGDGSNDNIVDDNGDGGGGGEGDGGGEVGGGGNLTVAILDGTLDSGHVVNAEDHADGVEISGTGTVGATVAVTVTGVTETVVIGADGTWTVTFDSTEIDTGTYETPVSVTITQGDDSLTITDILVVDTEASVTFNAAATGGDGTVNAVEAAGLVTLTGTVEAGSTVSVVVNGVTYAAVVTGTTWSTQVPANTLAGGEYDQSVSVSAVDQYGNTASTSGTFHVDTITAVTVNTATVETDGVINFAERSDGVTITGTAQAGASVSVTMAGVTKVVIATAAGTWSADYAAGEVPSGETTATVTAVATDQAGNTATASGTVTIDTFVNLLTLNDGTGGADSVVNKVESGQPITLSGTVEQGSSVVVTLAGVSMTATVAANGTWSATFPPNTLPAGTYDATITVAATDAAGNTDSLSETVSVDTQVVPFTLSNPIEGDDIISRAEASDGVVLSGTVEAFSTVTIKLGAVTRSVTTGADGTYSVGFAASEIPSGEYVSGITATATDRAGNVATITDTVRVDTIVNRLTMDGPVEGDDMVNRVEASDGITLTGTVEAGSTVLVTFEGTTRAAVVDAAGNWSVTYGASEIPAGDYTATVTIAATDVVGNTRSITDSFEVDTIPPEAPLIESYTRAGAGVRGLSTTITDDTLDIQQVAVNGTVSAAPHTVVENTAFNELDFEFSAPIPNGSHLIISNSDESGNTTSTLFVLEETGNNAVNVNNVGLDGFDIEAIDLQFAEDSVLTLTAADLESLSAVSNTLTIHGRVDDRVNILGATETGQTAEIGGRTYHIYSLGDNGGSLIIDESITVVT